MSHGPDTRNIIIPYSLWRAVKLEALQDEVSANEIVRRALRFYLANQKQATTDNLDKIRAGANE